MNTNYKRLYAIEQKNKERLLKICPKLNEKSGIYILTREENDFKYAYIGQAKHILTRLSQHLTGYQHIDLSIKKHGLYNSENLTGWKIDFFNCGEIKLDEKEQEYILHYARNGYQLRNKTSGSQSNGKFGIADNKPSKTYRDGLRRGYLNARKDVAKLFDINLVFTYRGEINKNKEKALQKFREFLMIENDEKI